MRFNAARSLRRLDGVGGALAGYEFVAEAKALQPFVDNVTSVWQSQYRGGAKPEVLMGPRGLLRSRFDQLYARRDDRPVYIAE